MIQAIETSYNGYRFRSRLEARWAVFFDAIGWPYVYESEGYYVNGLGPYLPDFRVMAGGECLELEIKRDIHTLNEQERANIFDRWTAFVNETNQENAALIFGDPYIDMHAFVTDPLHPKGYRYGFLTQCPCCTEPSLLIVPAQIKQSVWNAPGFDQTPYKLARSARFEHGETPTLRVVANAV